MEYNRLPYPVKEALISVCGKAFWLKQPLINLMLAAGVREELIHQFEDESKYKMVRCIISSLEKEGAEGWVIQKRLLTTMCNLRNLVDDTVPDRNAGLDALRNLKMLAIKENLVRREAKEDAKAKEKERIDKAKEFSERKRRLDELRKLFSSLVTSSNVQSRGYYLEDLLKELFEVSEIEYHKSYKTPTGQIDGHFHFEGFDYLVEARWRTDQPTVSEIGGFKVKVDKVIESTRGLFVAIQGIRDEVINQFSGEGAKLIFMDGRDLICILEGLISLRDGLKFKIEKAVQEGKVFCSLLEI
jgi:hypothetical protein